MPDPQRNLEVELVDALMEAEVKAWDALSRYKFQMYGYWAAIWVHLNRIGGFNLPNPWQGLVKTARTEKRRLAPAKCDYVEEVAGHA